jgi:hypothetical protein
MKNITIIPNISWGKTLELLQEKNTIRISSCDSETFEKLLNSINLKFIKEDDLTTRLSRFTLSQTVA